MYTQQQCEKKGKQNNKKREKEATQESDRWGLEAEDRTPDFVLVMTGREKRKKKGGSKEKKNGHRERVARDQGRVRTEMKGQRAIHKNTFGKGEGGGESRLD